MWITIKIFFDIDIIKITNQNNLKIKERFHIKTFWYYEDILRINHLLIYKIRFL